MLDRIKRQGAFVSLTLTSLMLGAFAMAGGASATTDPVESGFTDAGTKVTLYGGLLITLVLIGFGIMLGVKYLGKGFRKA